MQPPPCNLRARGVNPFDPQDFMSQPDDHIFFSGALVAQSAKSRQLCIPHLVRTRRFAKATSDCASNDKSRGLIVPATEPGTILRKNIVIPATEPGSRQINQTLSLRWTLDQVEGDKEVPPVPARNAEKLYTKNNCMSCKQKKIKIDTLQTQVQISFFIIMLQKFYLYVKVTK